MTHGSLFSGIGGFDLAAEWMGWENIFHCEWNPFGQKVLNYYWPKAISYNDITKTDFTSHRGTIDVLSGGFPFQPFSTAGQQKGTDDERYLWPEMLRAIQQIQPNFIVAENVSGLVTWSNGLVFEKVQSDLEAEGYEVTPFLLPAAGIGAPHRRDRIWFVCRLISNTTSNGFGRYNQFKKIGDLDKCGVPFDGVNTLLCPGITTNSVNQGLQSTKQQIVPGSGRIHQRRAVAEFYKTQIWDRWPTQSPVCNGNDGLPGKLDGIAFPNWRSQSIKAGGNAIVPQVALQIFKAIEAFTKL